MVSTQKVEHFMYDNDLAIKVRERLTKRHPELTAEQIKDLANRYIQLSVLIVKAYGRKSANPENDEL